MSAAWDLAVKEYKRTGDLKLRNKILEYYIPFIKKQVNYLCFDIRYKADFEQEAMIGFLEALERYNEGGSFKTCVFWGIKKRILDFYQKSTSAVKTTNRYNVLLSIVRKHKATYFAKHGVEMTDDALREVLTEREQHVWELSKAENSGLDSVENIEAYSVNESTEREISEEFNLYKENLNHVMSGMTDDEKWLINARYGIGTEKQNLAEIGFFLKKSPQRIEQMQRAVENKIRKRLNLRNGGVSKKTRVPKRAPVRE